MATTTTEPVRPEPTRPESSSQIPRGGSPGRPPWTRLLLFLAVGGPALCIGGVPPWVLPGFLVLVAALWWKLCHRSDAPLRVPAIAAVLAVLAALTLLQWLPIPGMRGLLAPELQAEVVAALQGTSVSAPAGLSVTRADTGLEVARLVGLTVLVVAAAQISWRSTAAAITVAGTAVTLIGLTQGLAGIDEIWGVYAPRDAHGPSVALRGTFVNPNHQSGLLLLGIFCAAALARELHRRRMQTRDPTKYDTYGDWLFASVAAAAIQIAGLILSLSRAGMLAGLVLAPIGLTMALYRRPGARASKQRSGRGSTHRWLIALGFVLLAVVIGQHRAWAELETLLDLTAEEAKYRTAVEGLSLIGYSPIVGIGRGGFIDLFPPIDSAPGPVLFTHLESAPVAMLVEWGPAVGSFTLLAAVGWWVHTFWSAKKRDDARSRRIALLGLAAVGLQNIGDFSLEFIGVAAPACALAGALGSTRSGRLSVRHAQGVGMSLLVLAAALAVWSGPDTWSQRSQRNEALRAGNLAAETLLRARPLDGRLHATLARRAAERGDWPTARRRASVATQRLPGSMDAWLVLGAARAELGDERGGQEATRRGLALIKSNVDEELVAYLLGRFPTPQELVAVIPDAPSALTRLFVALRDRAPEYADALAAAWSRMHPEDPLPLRLRSDLARRRGRPGLALHYARLLRQLAPDEATSYVTLAAALGAFPKARTAEIIETYEAALGRDAIDEPRARGMLEEQLLHHLLRHDDPDALPRIEALAEVLLTRPTKNRAERRRREKLVARARQHLESPDADSVNDL